MTRILAIGRSRDAVPEHIFLARTAGPCLLTGHRTTMAANTLVYVDQHPILRTISVFGVWLPVVFLPQLFRHVLSFQVKLGFLDFADLIEMAGHWPPEIWLEVDFMDWIDRVVIETIPVALSNLLTLPSEIYQHRT